MLDDKLAKLANALRHIGQRISDHYESQPIAVYNKIPDINRYTLLTYTYYKHSGCINRAYITVNSMMARMGIDKKSLHTSQATA